MSGGCGSCAARRARQNASRWTWTSDDGTQTSMYEGKYAEVQANAKVKRRGGTATPTVPADPE